MIRGAGYRAGTAGLHTVGPIGNLLLLAALLTVGLAPTGIALKTGTLGLIFALGAISDASPLTFLGSLRFVLAFAAILFVAQVLSIREGAIVFTIGLPITVEGLRSGAEMALRFLVILSSSFLFVTVTDPDRLAGIILRTGVSYRYGYVPILALRFVPFFRSELRTVREAQRIRGIRTSVRSLSGIRRAVRFTFVPVLVAGLMRVDSITMSMKGRAFGLHRTRTNASPISWTRGDWAAAFGCGGLIAVVWIAWRYAWP